jgi:hypothetical protein
LSSFAEVEGRRNNGAFLVLNIVIQPAARTFLHMFVIALVAVVCGHSR